ncbi:MAG: hypothetical protein LDL31_04085 [Prosthecobacter sp.]|nr:hypothetical protein [Prosthecobacter sp.]
MTDIFISKEKLAIFWFLCALGCLVYTAWHVEELAVQTRGSMLYVPTALSPVYLDEDLSRESREELLDYHARLAVETYLNRGPQGPLSAARLGYLFTGKGLEQAVKEARESLYDFKKQQIHQLMEVARVEMEMDLDGSAKTIITGQLVRVSVDPLTQEPVVQSFRVLMRQNWDRNKNLRDARRFAWVCTEITDFEQVENRVEPKEEEK